ncbi:hypothetical protein BCT06_13795 [Vibrio breoganii]|uniref:hypothetical protein n=1 Tax=Vibrio breoganii TaxID=553239 RepID=UPI000C85447E|nr:hypothetical protein [Vibrio breoganii]PMO59977.1 hypothetical protein BCT06_13795 [Vibrio breoganii]
MHNRLYIATTFRDFTGGDNDIIQHRFLSTLKEQSVPVTLLVTTFGEINVVDELKRTGIDFEVFEGDKGEFRYSLTDVLLNAINYLNDNKIDCNLMWTTCDVLFDSDFAQTVNKNISLANNKPCIATSHPNVQFNSLNLMENEFTTGSSYIDAGFDLLIFNRSFYSNLSVIDCIANYRFYDWGIFEHFLISLKEIVNESFLLNVHEESKIIKIANDRNITNEPSQFLIDSHKRNSIVFDSFLSEKNVSRMYYDLTFCHFKFKNTTNDISHKIRYSREYISNIITEIKSRLK